ncbi:hypothetical protein [Micromonospora sp. WMMD714]|uniref:hypothetical protein n=1 Tax=Micromonospora sp. WMMD714 TaxID=3016097 RepID=UPI00249C53B8|nr:hypothetical protein [Micromonospora sp. WMMD714]WFE65208.1 hypothetical protein O7625_18850 [Micromonospora sp. WMMD714]
MGKRALRQRMAGTMVVVTLVAGGVGTTAGAAQAVPVPAAKTVVNAGAEVVARGLAGM